MIQTERVPTGIARPRSNHRRGLAQGPIATSLPVNPEPEKPSSPCNSSSKDSKSGEKCIFVTADEGPIDVLEQAASLGWDLEPYVEAK